MKKTTEQTPLPAWQTDPNQITTERVQYWINGIMMTARATQAEARKLVQEGKAFVISDQAIGALETNGIRNA